MSAIVKKWEIQLFQATKGNNLIWVIWGNFERENMYFGNETQVVLIVKSSFKPSAGGSVPETSEAKTEITMTVRLG